MMIIKKNDIITLEITGMTSQGSGVARRADLQSRTQGVNSEQDFPPLAEILAEGDSVSNKVVDKDLSSATNGGMVVFVPHTAVGDVVNARILKVKKNYAFARVENIVTSAASRVTPDCAQFPQCGGCVYRHISYEEELKIKQQRVADALTRIGGIADCEILSIVGCDSPNHYRNKSQIPIGTDKSGALVMGFYGSHSHRIVNCESCKLHPPIFDSIAHVVKLWAAKNSLSTYDETNHKGLLRHLYIRAAEKSGEIMVCLVINGDTLPRSDKLTQSLVELSDNIKSIILNINKEKTNVILGKKCVTLYGKDYITDELCGLTFNISPLSFYQVNRSQAEKLYGIAADFAGLRGDEFLLDLYCGTGTIGLSMASKVKRLLGVEIIPQAVDNARENARRNGIVNAEFICADAAQAAERLCENHATPDVVVLDPPRKGCDSTVITAVQTMRPSRVVYVSCDPETLARDLKAFGECGYRTINAAPVDMFPRTSHVETVALMVRKDK